MMKKGQTAPRRLPPSSTERNRSSSNPFIVPPLEREIVEPNEQPVQFLRVTPIAHPLWTDQLDDQPDLDGGINSQITTEDRSNDIEEPVKVDGAGPLDYKIQGNNGSEELLQISSLDGADFLENVLNIGPEELGVNELSDPQELAGNDLHGQQELMVQNEFDGPAELMLQNELNGPADLAVENEFDGPEPEELVDNVLNGPDGTSTYLNPKVMFHHDLVICRAEHPSKFFIQRVGADTIVQRLERLMKVWYETRNFPAVEEIKPKAFYVCRLPTHKKEWCRVYVQNFSTDEDHVDVLLIDHGLEITIGVNRIYPLQKQFARLPAAAIPATIPIEKGTVWTEEAIALFKSEMTAGFISIGIIDRFMNDHMHYEVLKMFLIITDGDRAEHDNGGKFYSFGGQYRFGYVLARSN